MLFSGWLTWRESTVSLRAAEESKVKPKTKILALTFGLVLPYIALAMYFALRIQEHPLSTWFPVFRSFLHLGNHDCGHGL